MRSVQFSRLVMSDSLQPCGLQHTRPPCYHQLLEFTQTSNHLIFCCYLLHLPSIFPSIRVFSNESALHVRQPTYWSTSFNISPCNEYSGLISFRMNWLDLLAVPGTLKSLLQHHSFKASILQRSSLLYGPTLMSIHDYWKNHNFVPIFDGKVISLPFF